MIFSSPDLHWTHSDLSEASQASFTRIRILSATSLFWYPFRKANDGELETGFLRIISARMSCEIVMQIATVICYWDDRFNLILKQIETARYRWLVPKDAVFWEVIMGHT